MKNTLKYILSLVFFVVVTAQTAWADAGVEMADTMRSNGKIYVVVAVLVLVLTGLLLYLINLDRKIQKLKDH